MAMNVTPFVGTDNFNMETFNNMISQINNGVNSEISEVFAQLGTKAKIQTGSYVGTGTYGESNPCSLTFDFVPIFIFIAAQGSPSSMELTIYNSTVYGYTTRQSPSDAEFWPINSGGNYANNVSLSNKTITWYQSTSGYQTAQHQLNSNGVSYNYIVLG